MRDKLCKLLKHSQYKVTLFFFISNDVAWIVSSNAPHRKDIMNFSNSGNISYRLNCSVFVTHSLNSYNFQIKYWVQVEYNTSIAIPTDLSILLLIFLSLFQEISWHPCTWLMCYGPMCQGLTKNDFHFKSRCSFFFK